MDLKIYRVILYALTIYTYMLHVPNHSILYSKLYRTRCIVFANNLLRVSHRLTYHTLCFAASRLCAGIHPYDLYCPYHTGTKLETQLLNCSISIIGSILRKHSQHYKYINDDDIEASRTLLPQYFMSYHS